jgi:hypothetical protein
MNKESSQFIVLLRERPRPRNRPQDSPPEALEIIERTLIGGNAGLAPAAEFFSLRRWQNRNHDRAWLTEGGVEEHGARGSIHSLCEY